MASSSASASGQRQPPQELEMLLPGLMGALACPEEQVKEVAPRRLGSRAQFDARGAERANAEELQAGNDDVQAVTNDSTEQSVTARLQLCELRMGFYSKAVAMLESTSIKPPLLPAAAVGMARPVSADDPEEQGLISLCKAVKSWLESQNDATLPDMLEPFATALPYLMKERACVSEEFRIIMICAISQGLATELKSVPQAIEMFDMTIFDAQSGTGNASGQVDGEQTKRKVGKSWDLKEKQVATDMSDASLSEVGVGRAYLAPKAVRSVVAIAKCICHVESSGPPTIAVRQAGMLMHELIMQASSQASELARTVQARPVGKVFTEASRKHVAQSIEGSCRVVYAEISTEISNMHFFFTTAHSSIKAWSAAACHANLQFAAENLNNCMILIDVTALRTTRIWRGRGVDGEAFEEQGPEAFENCKAKLANAPERCCANLLRQRAGDAVFDRVAEGDFNPVAVGNKLTRIVSVLKNMEVRDQFASEIVQFAGMVGFAHKEDFTFGAPSAVTRQEIIEDAFCAFKAVGSDQPAKACIFVPECSDQYVNGKVAEFAPTRAFAIHGVSDFVVKEVPAEEAFARLVTSHGGITGALLEKAGGARSIMIPGNALKGETQLVESSRAMAHLGLVTQMKGLVGCARVHAQSMTSRMPVRVDGPLISSKTRGSETTGWTCKIESQTARQLIKSLAVVPGACKEKLLAMVADSPKKNSSNCKGALPEMDAAIDAALACNEKIGSALFSSNTAAKVVSARNALRKKNSTLHGACGEARGGFKTSVKLARAFSLERKSQANGQTAYLHKKENSNSPTWMPRGLGRCRPWGASWCGRGSWRSSGQGCECGGGAEAGGGGRGGG
ncbi:unnamed protein product [Prorocentrum cordatum]|uniref:Uncharacterized protein n=1 Tax=Prorocentrum cordatum TaxID=2364126 RepID=A0ABN9QV59_9DINO|nr:unnamed protein product [Polarella glacialis]